MSDLIEFEEAKTILGVSDTELWDLINEGKIKKYIQDEKLMVNKSNVMNIKKLQQDEEEVTHIKLSLHVSNVSEIEAADINDLALFLLKNSNKIVTNGICNKPLTSNLIQFGEVIVSDIDIIVNEDEKSTKKSS